MYNTETIERFIDLTPKNDLRTQTKAAWGSNIFWLLISLIGFGAGGAAFAYGIIIICLGLFASVVFQIKRKDKTVYGVVFLSSFLSLLFVINFTLAAEIFCELAALPIALKSAAAAVPVIAAFAFTFVIDRRVKNGAIKDSKGTGKSNKAASSAVWSVRNIVCQVVYRKTQNGECSVDRCGYPSYCYGIPLQLGYVRLPKGILHK